MIFTPGIILRLVLRSVRGRAALASRRWISWARARTWRCSSCFPSRCSAGACPAPSGRFDRAADRLPSPPDPRGDRPHTTTVGYVAGRFRETVGCPTRAAQSPLGGGLTLMGALVIAAIQIGAGIDATVSFLVMRDALVKSLIGMALALPVLRSSDWWYARRWSTSDEGRGAPPHRARGVVSRDVPASSRTEPENGPRRWRSGSRSSPVSRSRFLRALPAPLVRPGALRRRYRNQANDNRIREIRVRATRRILDRNGKVLVASRTELAVEVSPQDLPSRDRSTPGSCTSSRPSPRCRSRRSARRCERSRAAPGGPVIMKRGLGVDKVYYLRENQSSFPGVTVDACSAGVQAGRRGSPLRERRRGYRRAAQAAALPGLHQGDLVGQSGIEYEYDRYLRGSPGHQVRSTRSADPPAATKQAGRARRRRAADDRLRRGGATRQGAWARSGCPAPLLRWTLRPAR